MQRRAERGSPVPRAGTAAALLSAFLFSFPGLAEGPPGNSVPAGTTRTEDVVSFGKPLAVAGDVEGTVVSVDGSVTVTGRVRGDVVVLGGDGVILEGGRVSGDLLVVGGSGKAADGTVAGRVRTLSALEAAFLSELRTSPLEGGEVSLLLAAFRLLLLAFWLAGGLVLLRLLPRRVQSAAMAVTGGELAIAAGLGVSAVLTGVLLATFFLAVLPSWAAVILIALVAAAVVAAKLFGLAVLFVVAGRLLTRSAPRGSALFGDPAALAIGLLPFGLASLVPGAGPLIWGIASLLGIGLAIRTAFGSFDPVLSVARA
jgi:hypothetical protein